MLSKKKKIFILVTMALLLVVTGYLNIVLNNNTVPTSGTVLTTGNFFATYRTDRQSTRAEEIQYYDAIIASESSSAEAKASAEAKKEKLIDNMETELVTEGLIKAKGFEDVIVTNSLSSVNVIVKSAELTKPQVAQIVDIVKLQTGIIIDYIRIIPVQ